MATKGAMGRDPKAGGGRASIGRDPMEMRRYQEALNRAKGMDVNSEAYARNKAIAEATGAKYGLNWQQGLTQGAQPRQQPNQKSAYEQELDRQRGPQLDTTANAQGQYRLSPGVYGTKEQAQQSYNQEMEAQRMRGPSVPWGGGINGANPYNDKMYRYPVTQGPINPEDYKRFLQGVTGMGGMEEGEARRFRDQLNGRRLNIGYPESGMGVRLPDGRYGSPQELAQMMQGAPRQDMTANKQGQYRLSPGMYGNERQAEQQQARDMEQFMANYPQAAVLMQEQDQGGGGGYGNTFREKGKEFIKYTSDPSYGTRQLAKKFKKLF